ncbi:hypothetical protein NDU88_000903 [Pleurodeles waltl]|uniref:Uncharacterized protein n=1 Tax=Pleurodeles waltl TaxID=8319 RepID=A0AAV7V848_PLEWA|nr:hypothetical protein NDU88_000903 [Pleurodeles waltl]
MFLNCVRPLPQIPTTTQSHDLHITRRLLQSSAQLRSGLINPIKSLASRNTQRYKLDNRSPLRAQRWHRNLLASKRASSALSRLLGARAPHHSLRLTARAR